MAGKTPYSKLVNTIWPFIAGRLKPSALAATPSAGLMPPTLELVVLEGMTVYMKWTASAGAEWYEVYRNEVPSSDGKAFVRKTTATEIRFAYQRGTSELLTTNRGAENGTFNGWTVNDWLDGAYATVSGTTPHAGNYSFHLTYVKPSPQDDMWMRSDYYPVQENTSYALGLWYKVPQFGAGAVFVFLANWLDGNGNSLRVDDLLSLISGTSSWTQYSGSRTAPVGAKFVQLQVSLNVSVGAVIEAYLDEFSLQGPPPTSTITDLFAVCAVNQDGPTALSEWMAPELQTVLLKSAEALGDVFIQFNPGVGGGAPSIASTDYAAGAAGFSLRGGAAGESHTNAGSTAGWMINANAITADSGNAELSSAVPSLRLGATGYLNGTGFWVGKHSGAYKAHLGDPTTPNAHYLKWDGNALTIVGSLTATTGQIGGWTIGANSISADSGNAELSSAVPNLRLGATGYLDGTGFWVGKNDGIYRAHLGDPTTPNAHYLKWDGNALTIVGSITAQQGTIGNWTIATNTISADSGNISLNSATPKITLGEATDYLTGAGVFMGKDAGSYKWRVGDTGGNWIGWDGGNLAAGGNWLTGNATKFFNIPIIDDAVWTNNSPSAGYVAWNSFTLTYQGTSYTITAGNTNLKYIWWNKANSTTILQSNNTPPDGALDQFLVCVNFGGTARPCLFQNMIYADFIKVNQLSAITADLGSITAGTITGGTIRTAASGARLVLDTSKLTLYDATNAIMGVVGDLDSQYGIATHLYGVGIGDYAGGNYLRFEPMNGLVLHSGGNGIELSNSGLKILQTSATSNVSKNAGTVADDASYGTVAWTSPTLAQGVPNDTWAYNHIVMGADTHWLKSTNFGFSIPANAVVTRVAAFIQWRNCFVTYYTPKVKMVVGGSIVGNLWSQETSSTSCWADQAVAAWGVTPTAAQVNASNFGFVYATSFTDNPPGYALVDPGVDYVILKVTYTIPAVDFNNTQVTNLGAATQNGQAVRYNEYSVHTHTLSAMSGNLTQARSHDSPDTDSATTSLHHTIGAGATQAAAGNHTHSTYDTHVAASTAVHGLGSGVYVFGTKIGSNRRVEHQSGAASVGGLSSADITLTWTYPFTAIGIAVAGARSAVGACTAAVKSFSNTQCVVAVINNHPDPQTVYADAIAVGT